ncbi:MAG: hypothetical protein LBJ01_11735 [Tannerella sp.]|jgi:hypothetical protein|nr:hypothetical protein [Tannerella sp.]
MQTTDWKAKCNLQTRKSKELKKRIKELTKSRDERKGKSVQHRERADKWVADLKKSKTD